MPQTPDLRGVPIFEHLDDDERAEFEELSEPVSFEAGQRIFEEGALEGWLFVITSGTVKVYKRVLPDRDRRDGPPHRAKGRRERRGADEGRGARPGEGPAPRDARRRLPGGLQARLRDRPYPRRTYGRDQRDRCRGYLPPREHTSQRIRRYRRLQGPTRSGLEFLAHFSISARRLRRLVSISVSC
jgi:hypothetical protein